MAELYKTGDVVADGALLKSVLFKLLFSGCIYVYLLIVSESIAGVNSLPHVPVFGL